MRTLHCPSGSTHSSSNISSSSSNSNSTASSGGLIGTMSPPNSAVLTLTVALILSAIPLCKSAPVLQQRPTIDYDQLQSQVDDICLSFLSQDSPYRAGKALGEVCVLMLGALQKAQGLTPRDNSKRFLFHYARSKAAEVENEASGDEKILRNGNGKAKGLSPPQKLISAMPPKKQARRTLTRNDVQGPGGIQSRGYFLYRPRNGRRSSEYV